MYNATCNGRDCNMCACKDFKTFLSYKAGCVSKQKGDEFLGGKFFLQIALCTVLTYRLISFEIIQMRRRVKENVDGIPGGMPKLRNRLKPH